MQVHLLKINYNFLIYFEYKKNQDQKKLIIQEFRLTWHYPVFIFTAAAIEIEPFTKY